MLYTFHKRIFEFFNSFPSSDKKVDCNQQFLQIVTQTTAKNMYVYFFPFLFKNIYNTGTEPKFIQVSERFRWALLVLY